MILTKEDLRLYLEEDKKVLGKTGRKRPKLFTDEIWRFQIYLRKHEYYENIKPNIINRIKKLYYRVKHKRMGIKLGFSIPINVFGPGLRINHFGYIVVNPNARVGAYCNIHQGVNIGQNNSAAEVPSLGDNIWIGPGAKIFGKITIADSIAVGANSVVNKSFTKKNITIAGVPAKQIKGTGTNEMNFQYKA